MAEQSYSTTETSQEKKSLLEQAESKELRERLERLETGAKEETLAESKEKIVKQEIKEYLQELQRIPVSAPSVTLRDQADEIKKFPSSQQVGALVSLVFEKGLKQAVSVALNLDNPAVLDEFHDILVDRYYQELIEKKILKLS